MNHGPQHAMPKRATRMLRGVVSSGFGMIVRIGLQLAQVPVLLSFWSIERYGEWLLIFTVPTLLMLSGIGVGTVAANSAAAAMSAGDAPRARSLFRGAWGLVTVSNAILLAVAVMLLSSHLIAPLMRFNTITFEDGRQAVILLVVLVVLRLQCAVSEVVFRARGQYGEYQFLENLTQIGEFLALTLSLVLWGGVVAAAASLVFVRSAVLCALQVRLVFYDRWILVAGDKPTLTMMQELMKPSFSLLLFPVAQFIQFEGATLLVGATFGPREVAAYVSVRTVSRLADTLLIMVHNIIQAETGYFAGEGNKAGLARFLAFGTLACALIAIGLVMAITLIGPVIFPLWTAGKIAFDKSLLNVVVVVTLVRATYMAAAGILVGLNRHGPLALAHFCGALLSIGVAILMTRFGAGFLAVLACTWIGEIVLTVVAWKSILLYLDMRPDAVWRSLLVGRHEFDAFLRRTTRAICRR